MFWTQLPCQLRNFLRFFFNGIVKYNNGCNYLFFVCLYENRVPNLQTFFYNLKLRATKLARHYFTTLTLTLQHESLKMVSIVFCSDIKRPTGSPKQFRGFQIDNGILQLCEFQVLSVRNMSSIFGLTPTTQHIFV